MSTLSGRGMVSFSSITLYLLFLPPNPIAFSSSWYTSSSPCSLSHPLPTSLALSPLSPLSHASHASLSSNVSVLERSFSVNVFSCSRAQGSYGKTWPAKGWDLDGWGFGLVPGCVAWRGRGRGKAKRDILIIPDVSRPHRSQYHPYRHSFIRIFAPTSITGMVGPASTMITMTSKEDLFQITSPPEVIDVYRLCFPGEGLALFVW